MVASRMGVGVARVTGVVILLFGFAVSFEEGCCVFVCGTVFVLLFFDLSI